MNCPTTNCLTTKHSTTALLRLAFGIMAVATGCATTSVAPDPLAAVQGTEDASYLCAGIPTKERELGLLSYRDAISGIAALRDPVKMGKTLMVGKYVGVQIGLRAQPALTAPWLGRVASCHAALAATNQLKAPDAQNDPFLVPGVQISVQEAYSGFVISVRGTDASMISDVTDRAAAMRATPDRPTTAQGE
jgi:hypothetical protein